jgi:hypothetical protein
MLATTYVPSSASPIAVSVVLMPAICGRHSAMKPIVWLPHAIASATAISSRSESRELSSWSSALTIHPLATSPAA